MRRLAIRQRWFKQLGILSVVSVVFVLFVVLALHFLSRNIATAQLYVSDGGERRVQLASALDLPQGTDTNLIKNSSFSPLTYRFAYRVLSGKQNKLIVQPATDLQAEGQVSLSDEDYLGSRVNVLQNDIDGQRTRTTGTVASYHTELLQEIHSLDYQAETSYTNWQVQAEYQNSLYLGGERGQILIARDYSYFQIHQLPTTADIKQFGIADNQVLALDTAGELWQEKHGDWYKLVLDYPKESLGLLATRQTKQQGKLASEVLLASEHALYRLQDNKLIELDTPKDFKVSALASNHTGFYVASKTILWQIDQQNKLQIIASSDSKDDWQQINVRDSKVLIRTNRGRLLVLEQDQKLHEIDQSKMLQQFRQEASARGELLLRPKWVDAQLLSTEQVAVLDSQGHCYFVSTAGELLRDADNNQVLHALRQEQIKNLQLFNSGRLLWLSQTGKINYAFAGLELQIANSEKNIEYNSQDVVWLEKSLVQLPTNYDLSMPLPGEWWIKESAKLAVSEPEQGGVLEIEIDAAQTSKQSRIESWQGLYSKQMMPEKWQSLVTDQAQACQTLELNHAHANNVYNLQFSARVVSENQADADATIKFGVGAEDTESTTTTRKLSGHWRRYLSTVVLPSGIKESTLYLAVEANKKVRVQIDDVKLLPAIVDSEETLAELKKISEKSTGYLRLVECSIGGYDQSSEYWVGSTSGTEIRSNKNKFSLVTRQSLSEQLLQIASLKQNPWLVIKPYCSAEEIRHLMQFLAGESDTTYGKLRTAQGALNRYTDSFQSIVLEIVDDDICPLPNDTAKHFVAERLLAEITATAEFKQFASKIVLIDGMHYQEEQKNLSTADLRSVRAEETFSQGTSINEQSDNKQVNYVSELNNVIKQQSEELNTSAFARSKQHFIIRDLPNNAQQFSEYLLPYMLYRRQFSCGEELTKFDELSRRSYQLLSSLQNAEQLKTDLKKIELAGDTQNIESMNLEAFAFSIPSRQGRKTMIYLLNCDEKPLKCHLNLEEQDRYQLEQYDASAKLQSAEEIDHTATVQILPGQVVVIQSKLD